MPVFERRSIENPFIKVKNFVKSTMDQIIFRG